MKSSVRRRHKLHGANAPRRRAESRIGCRQTSAPWPKELGVLAAERFPDLDSAIDRLARLVAARIGLPAALHADFFSYLEILILTDPELERLIRSCVVIEAALN